VVYKKVRNNVWNSKTLLTTVLLLVGLSYTKKDISGQVLLFIYLEPHYFRSCYSRYRY